MSNLRTPLRSRSSMSDFHNGNAFSTPQRSSQINPTFSELKRPPSARSNRPSSPRMSVPPNTNSLQRPRSSLGSRSRPPTPSFMKQEPYTGTILVSIRPNPYMMDSNQSQWLIDETSNTIINNSDFSEFQFDNVFQADVNITNRIVYDRSCANIVEKFLNEGYNSTVFAYGMTGSGKTFSMRGDESDPGFVKLAVDDIFDKIESDISEKQYGVSITYLEIYNERIIDLLNSGPVISSDLKIRDDPVYGTKIMGITNPTITTRNQILQYIDKGDNKRKTSETDFNTRSSRSHAILQIRLNTVDLVSGTQRDCTLSLCDLAGSEKATSSLERRKEGSFINKSLLALSNVINKLSVSTNSGALSDHIPYRDSKLTRLLQPALSGNSLVLILCTIHMGSAGVSNRITDNQSVSETYNTLRFAARAKDIVMNVQKTKLSIMGDDVKVIEELRKTIENQRNEISILKAQGVGQQQDMAISETTELAAENRVLHERIQHLTRLTDLQKTEMVILKNDALNEILGSNIDHNNAQLMVANLEEFSKRVNYEMDEYRLYIGHLEHQLKQKELLKHQDVKQAHGLTERQVEILLKDQEEEIMHLKEVIKDKDHFIKSLTKTSKLRRMVDSDINTLDKANKENSLREFNISSKTGGKTNFAI